MKTWVWIVIILVAGTATSIVSYKMGKKAREKELLGNANPPA